ncbi:MAG TPA: ABC transporter ATP-binding protein [Actinocrinis sp.]|jgi:ABC-2 type transport system ATP-binding protein
MTAIIQARQLAKRYGQRAALSNCTLSVPSGRVVGLVGPNGAGKSTLLKLACGMLAPSSGTITVLGHRPGAGSAQISRVAFVAQDAPVYPALSIADHLKLGARLNPRWNQAYATARIADLHLDPAQRAGRLSGGQRAQLALTLATGKQPDLLILDEPVASLDPLARRDFLRQLMQDVAEHGTSVVLSSHLISDLELVCDHLIVLSASHVRLTGDVERLTATHHRITCARRDPATLPAGLHVIAAEHTDRQSTFIVHSDTPPPKGDWAIDPVGLEELVLTYMEHDRGRDPGPGGDSAAADQDSADQGSEVAR